MHMYDKIRNLLLEYGLIENESTSLLEGELSIMGEHAPYSSVLNLFSECTSNLFNEATKLVNRWEAENSLYEMLRYYELVLDNFPECDIQQEEFREWFFKNVELHFPDSYFWGMDIRVNLILDTGDSNYDYSLNLLKREQLTEKEESNSSLLWLINQQGYTHNDVFRSSSRFPISVRNEIEHCIAGSNTVEFLLTITVRELCQLLEEKQNGVLKQIVIPSKTNCGLVDHFNGAGGRLEIQLEKDVVLPAEYIGSILPDGAIGFSCRSIYGLLDFYWNSRIKSFVS